MTRVVLAAPASADLRRYGRWLAREAGDDVAEAWLAALTTWIYELQESPERGTPRPDLGVNARTRVFRRNVTMVYAVRSDTAAVLRIFGRGRDITAESMRGP